MLEPILRRTKGFLYRVSVIDIYIKYDRFSLANVKSIITQSCKESSDEPYG